FQAAVAQQPFELAGRGFAHALGVQVGPPITPARIASVTRGTMPAKELGSCSNRAGFRSHRILAHAIALRNFALPAAITNARRQSQTQSHHAEDQQPEHARHLSSPQPRSNLLDFVGDSKSEQKTMAVVIQAKARRDFHRRTAGQLPLQYRSEIVRGFTQSEAV